MPTPKEMEKLASTGGNSPASRPLGPCDEMPAEYWESVANDSRLDAEAPGPSVRTLRLSEISRHLLRVSCLALLGFGLASVAMMLQLRFNFEWAVAMAVVAALGLTQIIGWFRKRS